ncbi:helix-turn-helix domain-containing protein [Salinispirillum marinum]|uniref:Helix-turn-helix domain-containing protein n=2 Tax=Saccharospirillaceae TaxID=255527 RepID=A0ABV8BE90_9GAMM
MTDQAHTTDTAFSDRLRDLIGTQTTSAFARKVGLSESLIRKYLAGSEPSLSKANQIAQRANVSLEWLATGHGYLYRQAEVVDLKALDMAMTATRDILHLDTLSTDSEQQMKVMVAIYQHLRATKRPDGYLEPREALKFGEYVATDCDEPE